MSATLGNTAAIEEALVERSGREVASVKSGERPVPLEHEYRATPLHETVEELVASDRAPIYIVNFSQREASERAQALTSLNPASREGKERVWEAVGDFHFDTAHGKELRRFLGFGIGVHHAGLLPKYRLLVEQLAQQGLLKVVSGTDTLGVGVNVPIRTVLFTQLCKYDGSKTAILTVRDFKQIAGRAGRKGFDDKGWVVCQAPEHVIENQRLAEKANTGNKKKYVKRQPPKRGFVPWDEDTFKKLIAQPPEMLESQFRVDHGMVLNTLQHDASVDDPQRRNFDSLRQLIARSHEPERRKEELLSEAAARVYSLYKAGIVRLVRDVNTDYYWVTVNEDLQWGFSLLQNLSLFMVEILDEIDRDSPDYALDVVSLVESILEDPWVILRQQAERAKTEALAQMKADYVPYEERIERLKEITHPKPNEEFIYGTFDRFREVHPWVGGSNVSPKSIGREMYEGYFSFNDYVRLYGLKRSEGVLLRYLSQLYKTLVQSVPESYKTDELYDIQAYLRTELERTDTSLLEEWESLLHPELDLPREEAERRAREALRAHELFADPKAFTARVRAEMHGVVRSLAAGDWEEAAGQLRHDPEAPEGVWDAERLEEALVPFLEEYGQIVFTPEARQAHRTVIEQSEPRIWQVSQVLLDPEGDNLWHLDGEVDLTAGRPLEGPLVRLRRVGI
jgi:superfamily II RNA helicase